MNKFETTIEHLHKLIKLSEKEKRVMRTSVLEAMDSTPSPYMHFMTRMGRSVIFRGTLAALIMTLIGGAGIVGVSAQALPGDTFYTTKINLEEVQSLVKTSPTAKIAFEIKRTENRFEEVRTLVQENKFDTTKQEIVSEHIKEHVAVVTNEVTKSAFLKEKDHERVDTIDIQKVLETEQQRIVDLAEQEEFIAMETILTPEKTESLLALNEIVDLVEGHVETLEHIEVTIAAVLAETEELPSVPSSSSLAIDSTSPSDTTTLALVASTPAEDKIFVEENIASIQEKIKNHYPPIVAPEQAVLFATPELSSVTIDDASPLTSTTTTEATTLETTSTPLIIETVTMASDTPHQQASLSLSEQLRDDITITYDLLVSAYKAENYDAAKSLIAKLYAFLTTLAGPIDADSYPVTAVEESTLTEIITEPVEASSVTTETNPIDISITEKPATTSTETPTKKATLSY